MVQPPKMPIPSDTHDLKKSIDWGKWGTIAGIIAIVVAIIVPAYFYWIQRTDKALTYGVISQGPLVSVRDNLNGRLKILLDGKPIGSVNLIVLKVENTGTVAIRKADYDKPLSINFGPGSQVISSEIVTSRPIDLGETLKTTPQEIGLNPILMNRGDGFVIKALVNSPAPNVAISGRIADVTEIKRVDIAAPPQTNVFVSGVFMLFALGFSALSVFLTVKFSGSVSRQTREIDKQAKQIARIMAQQKQEIEDQSRQIDDIDAKIESIEMSKHS